MNALPYALPPSKNLKPKVICVLCHLALETALPRRDSSPANLLIPRFSLSRPSSLYYLHVKG
jgi:hypothetical protein